MLSSFAAGSRPEGGLTDVMVWAEHAWFRALHSARRRQPGRSATAERVIVAGGAMSPQGNSRRKPVGGERDFVAEVSGRHSSGLALAGSSGSGLAAGIASGRAADSSGDVGRLGRRR